MKYEICISKLEIFTINFIYIYIYISLAERHSVRYPSVSLSPTLSRNKKVEQHIRKKTHKPNALRFWVEGGVILLYGLTQFSFLFVSPVFTPSNYPTSGIRAEG